MPTATAAAATTFPDYADAIRVLVAQHLRLKGQHTLLAVHFAPRKKPLSDVCLFEVIEDFGPDQPDPDDTDLFQFGYGSTPGFPLPEGVSLRMVLTNPHELRRAIDQGWKAAVGLRAASRAGKAMVLHSDAEGDKLWELLQ